MSQDTAETRTVNVEVYCDVGEDGDRDVFAVASKHIPELPPLTDALNEFAARDEWDSLEVGDAEPDAGILEYVPHGEIVDLRVTEDYMADVAIKNHQ